MCKKILKQNFGREMSNRANTVAQVASDLFPPISTSLGPVTSKPNGDWMRPMPALLT